jgi:hypothetical protein
MTHAVTNIRDEGTLFEFLDEYLNANGAAPRVSGQDSEGTPFLAWLNEEGGDLTYLTVARLVTEDGGIRDRLITEIPVQGETSSLVYPVVIVDRRN